jgi:hypothetical protein
MIYASVREKTYLAYVAFVGMLAATMYVRDGLAAAWIRPHGHLLEAATVVTACHFTRTYLETRKRP